MPWTWGSSPDATASPSTFRPGTPTGSGCSQRSRASRAPSGRPAELRRAPTHLSSGRNPKFRNPKRRGRPTPENVFEEEETSHLGLAVDLLDEGRPLPRLLPHPPDPHGTLPGEGPG